MSPFRDMTAAEFLEAAQAVSTRFPTATLAKNQVGNLAVHVDGEYVAWVDLRYGTLELLDEEDE